jgi:drug/metabolite transporter (DMT)-like permease
MPRRRTRAEALSLPEAEKLRDRLLADEAKSTDTLSTIARSLAVGLALITYTFFFQKDHSDFVAQNFNILKVPSILGVMALIADGLQYFFAIRQVGAARDAIKRHIVSGRPLTVAQTERYQKNQYSFPRDAMFWLKLVLVVIGSGIVIYVLSNAAQTPAGAGAPARR